jgi:hypothetical protein
MKNRKSFLSVTAICALLQASSAFSMASHYSKSVSMIEVAAGSCYFFQLEGVTQADPLSPNVPWFAIPIGQLNAKEMYAVLMTVRVTGGTLQRVLTGDDTACGAPRVITIDL